MTNNDVALPAAGVSQSNYAIAKAIVTNYTRGETSVVSVDWAIQQIALARQTHTPADVQEPARRAAARIVDHLLTVEPEEVYATTLAAIIAGEFGGGEGGRRD